MLLCLTSLCCYDRLWEIYKEHRFISQNSETRKPKAKTSAICWVHPCFLLCSQMQKVKWKEWAYPSNLSPWGHSRQNLSIKYPAHYTTAMRTIFLNLPQQQERSVLLSASGSCHSVEFCVLESPECLLSTPLQEPFADPCCTMKILM